MRFRVECSLGFCGPDCTTLQQCTSGRMSNWWHSKPAMTISTLQQNVLVAYPTETPLLTAPSVYPTETPLPTSPSVYPTEIPPPTALSVYPTEIPLPTAPSVYPTEIPLPTAPSVYPTEITLPTAPSVYQAGTSPRTVLYSCLSGRNIISTRCITCLSGFTGSNCELGECYIQL